MLEPLSLNQMFLQPSSILPLDLIFLIHGHHVYNPFYGEASLTPTDGSCLSKLRLIALLISIAYFVTSTVQQNTHT